MIAGTQIPKKGVSRLAKVDFVAGGSDVTVRNVAIRNTSLGSLHTSTRVWFEQNGKRVTAKASFDGNRVADVSFSPAFVLKAGSRETFDFFVELNETNAGDDIQLTGEITNTSGEAKGSFLTNTVKTANYETVQAEFKRVGGVAISVNQTSDYMTLGDFNIRNQKGSSITDNRDMLFESITLKNEGNGDVFNLEDVYLEKNGQRLPTEVIMGSKELTFIVNDTIQNSKTASYRIKAKVRQVELTA